MSRPHFVLEPVDILVGVDGSDNSEQALAVAASIAVKCDASLRLVGAFTVPVIPRRHHPHISDAPFHNAARSTQDLLDQHVDRLTEAGIGVVAQAIEGDAGEVLAGASRFSRLTVVGKRGRNRLASRLLGTVSSKLVTHAHAPVLVVPYQQEDHTSDTPSATPRRDVVAGIDLGSTGLTVAKSAARAAQLCGKQLSLLSVTGTDTDAGLSPLLQQADDIQAQLRAEYSQNLDEVAQATMERHPDLAVNHQVIDGSAADVLSEVARAAPLVVVGSRGRGGLASLLLGSVSRTVLNHAESPVLVVPTRSD